MHQTVASFVDIDDDDFKTEIRSNFQNIFFLIKNFNNPVQGFFCGQLREFDEIFYIFFHLLTDIFLFAVTLLAPLSPRPPEQWNHIL